MKNLASIFAISENDAHALREMAELTVFARDPRASIVWENAFVTTAADLMAMKLPSVSCFTEDREAMRAMFCAYQSAGNNGLDRFGVARQWAANELRRIGIDVAHARVNVTTTTWNKALHEFACRIATLCQGIAASEECAVSTLAA
ncbi:MAG: hypothetical protein IKZ87_00155 [Actinomycetaceae bacterium]|nr:hypothetical protein [Actinomycetaceae bacterium]